MILIGLQCIFIIKFTPFLENSTAIIMFRTVNVKKSSQYIRLSDYVERFFTNDISKQLEHIAIPAYNHVYKKFLIHMEQSMLFHAMYK